MNQFLRKELERRVKSSEFSMKGLSKAVGHGETLVRDIITGRTKNPSLKIMEQLADKLECSVVELYGRESYDELVKANDNEQTEESFEKVVNEKVEDAPIKYKATTDAVKSTVVDAPKKAVVSGAAASTAAIAGSACSIDSKKNVGFVHKFAPLISFFLVMAGVYLILIGYKPSVETFTSNGRTFPGSGPVFDPMQTSVGFGVLYAAFFIYKGRACK